MQNWRLRLGEVLSRLLPPPALVATPEEPDPEPPVLVYMEETLSEAYKKEIDQEENVWRSLPFFAATLALQVTALVKVVTKMPPTFSIIGYVASGLLIVTGVLDVSAIVFLCYSIWPRRFRYVAPEPELLKYARDLIADEEEGQEDEGQEKPVSALVTLKWEIARQYAEGAAHNRLINKGRELWRARAGLAILISVLMTVFLAAVNFVDYLHVSVNKDPGNAAVHRTVPAGNKLQPSAGVNPQGDTGKPNSPPSAPHEGSGGGMVGQTRGKEVRGSVGGD